MDQDEEKAPPSGSLLSIGQLSRAELEREIGKRVTDRFSLTAVRAALFPRHQGAMENPDAFARTQGYCGDLMAFYLRIQDSRIAEITFTTDGCDATMASGEMLASIVAGISLENAERVTPDDVLEALDGLPPNHVHCAELAVSTLRQALADYRQGGHAL
jgi:nitrogen fixation NifU-like protein